MLKAPRPRAKQWCIAAGRKSRADQHSGHHRKTCRWPNPFAKNSCHGCRIRSDTSECQHVASCPAEPVQSTAKIFSN